jgi:hypothetical protein
MRAWGVALACLIAGCSNPSMAHHCGACAPNQMCCGTSSGDRCIDVFSDPNNCGVCGGTCASGQQCSLGQCSVPNDMGTPDAASAVDASIPGCGTAMCQPPCLAVLMCCPSGWVPRNGTTMVDGTHDPSFTNCGQCGTACVAGRASRCGVGSSGSAECLCGAGNTVQCAMGLTCVAAHSLCVNTDTDAMYCGASLTACAMGESCESGMCTCSAAHMRCPTGQTCGTNGCVDTMIDPMNCGAINHACRPGETCSGGTCHCGGGGACLAPGGPLSNHNCGTICCGGQCVYPDDTQCTGCGVACTSTQACMRINPLFSTMVACADSTNPPGFATVCDPAPPPMDAGADDAGATDDAGLDAAASDAGLDANTDAGP